jgi:hypothetical protein
MIYLEEASIDVTQAQRVEDKSYDVDGDDRCELEGYLSVDLWYFDARRDKCSSMEKGDSNQELNEEEEEGEVGRCVEDGLVAIDVVVLKSHCRDKSELGTYTKTIYMYRNYQ